MATIVRKKCVIEFVKKISRSRHFCGFIQTEGHIQARWLRNVPIAAASRLNTSRYTRWRCIHTGSPLQKIVAFKLSDIGEGIREVVIKEWFVKEGDKVEQFDNICEVQSDKAAVTITSRYDGVVTRLHAAAEEIVLVGKPLVDIQVADDVAGEDAPGTGTASVETAAGGTATPAAAAETSASGPAARVLTTPAVRRIASQYNLNLNSVKATGRNGRVLKEDVLHHLNLTSDQANVVPAAVHGTVGGAGPSGGASAGAGAGAGARPATSGQDRTASVSGFTKAMVKTMTESLKIPHFVLSDEYEVTELVRVRAQLKAAAAERGARLTYMPFVLKAASLALTQFPAINSSLDASCEHITYWAAHNIGVAMDTPQGLVVPVVKNVEQRSIMDIALELNRLQELGASGRLSLADLAGGTFTISNIGNVGGTYTKPVILAPQVAIGAIGRIQTVPRFDAVGAVRAARVLHASWSADHRVLDGVTLARFSNALKLYLEQPTNLLLDL